MNKAKIFINEIYHIYVLKMKKEAKR